MADPSDVTLFTQTPTEPEARVLMAALAEHEIEATCDGGAISGFVAEAPAWVRVLVRAADLPRARTLLETGALDVGDDVDWSKVDVGEPEDG
ncbi:MAG: DUF2007 domain-containing protein [Planctomycetota bacterium]